MNVEPNAVVRVNRRFNASSQRVFDAWLDPNMLSRWMFGPSVRDEEIVSLSLDPRPGGAFSFVVRRDGREINHVGEYLEIAARLPGRIDRLLEQTEKGRISIRFRHQGLDNLIDHLDILSNRLAMGLVIASLVIGSSMVIQSEVGPLIGGYLFIAVSGLFFIATGIFASSLSRNQAVSGILCFTLLFVVILGLHFVRDLQALNAPAMAHVKTAVEYAQVLQHLGDFSRGIVDVRQLLFYVSGSVLCLIFSILGVEAKLIHS